MEQLKEMLKSNYPTVDFDNETHLVSSGVLDSLAVVAIIAQIENLFDISVTMEYIQPAYFESVQTILLLGASILSVTWEETGLDNRIAAMFLSLIGSKLRNQVIFWYLLCAVLSAVLPNAVVCRSCSSSWGRGWPSIPSPFAISWRKAWSPTRCRFSLSGSKRSPEAITASSLEKN